MIRVKAEHFILLFIIILLSSCGGKDASISIEYWTHEDPARKEIEERLIADFEKENPGISVTRLEYESSELLDIINAAFQAGSGPDLFNLPSEEISGLLYNDKIAEINYEAIGYHSELELRNAYTEDAFDAVTLDGNIHGLPLECTIWCLYVNRALFEKVGLDPYSVKTWEDLVAAAELLSVRDEGVLIKRGFDFRYPYYLTFFVPMVKQLGGDIFSEDGEVVVSDEAWENALLFMKEWGPLGRNLGSPTYINARKIFNTEEIAMCLSGLYQESRMERENTEFFSSEDWLVLPFPIFENAVSDESSAVYFHYFMVNAASDETTRNAAWKLAGYFASHAEDYLDEIGLVMPLKRIFSSEMLSEKPFADIFLSDMERSHQAYYGPHAAEIQQLIGDAIESVMLLGTPPEKAVQALRFSIEALSE